jgi:two-component system, OmpR family, sensor histidine kinase VicK
MTEPKREPPAGDDLSSLRRENEELRLVAAAHERRYLDFFDSAADAYVVTNRWGTIVDANQAAERMIGISRRFLIGKPLHVYLGGFLAASQAVRAGRSFKERELELKPWGGTTLDVGVTASVVHDEYGATETVRWSIRDITLRRRAEEEVRILNAELEQRVLERTRELEAANSVKEELLRELAERTKVEREFVTNAAHELRTPVAAIASSVDVLQGGAKEDPSARDRFLTHIEEQCSRLKRLSHALLVLARVQMSQEPPRLEPTDVGSLLRDIGGQLMPAPGVELRVECEQPVVARANRELLEQALLNIAENAAKYARRGHITLSAAAADGFVSVAVSDSGPGMSPAEREHAFQRFQRGDRGEEGFGLGLAIAAQAVEALSGEIGIDSEAEAGTTVWIRLPAADT